MKTKLTSNLPNEAYIFTVLSLIVEEWNLFKGKAPDPPNNAVFYIINIFFGKSDECAGDECAWMMKEPMMNPPWWMRRWWIRRWWSVREPSGKHPMIHCGSRSLTDCQTRYATIELECLAIVWAIEKCSYYLKGSPAFTVITDHKPLVGYAPLRRRPPDSQYGESHRYLLSATTSNRKPHVCRYVESDTPSQTNRRRRVTVF